MDDSHFLTVGSNTVNLKRHQVLVQIVPTGDGMESREIFIPDNGCSVLQE